IYTNDDALAAQLHKIANHGQVRRYYHDVVGCNSRLDGIQAAILDVKLHHLDAYAAARQRAAAYYDHALASVNGLHIPVRQPNSTHVFHQYTLVIENGKRQALQTYLQEQGIPTMIYYPLPLYKQDAFRPFTDVEYLPVTEQLCDGVISLPMHTEMDEAQLEYICSKVRSFFN
ncbi:MAG: DegT/DnrJ/EryC1/StrS family aminotransferase, partial [Haliscomenobacter sp.]